MRAALGRGAAVQTSAEGPGLPAGTTHGCLSGQRQKLQGLWARGNRSHRCQPSVVSWAAPPIPPHDPSLPGAPGCLPRGGGREDPGPSLPKLSGAGERLQGPEWCPRLGI